MLEELIGHIDNAESWIRRFKPEDYDVKYINIARQRSRLRVVLRAMKENPAIAAFGKSQVGKSYLMSCLLQTRRDGQVMPFKIDGREIDGRDRKYDFITEINPIGDGKEATGVVTRFTSFSRNPDRYSPEYPVLARLLSLAEIVTILCDTYYNDYYNYTSPSEADINEFCGKLSSAYKHGSHDRDGTSIITTEDIFEMADYFRKHINNAQVFSNCSFFNELALVIDNVPSSDYAQVFSLLWNHNALITTLFERLKNVLEQLGYAEYIYLPINAVAHNGIKENTVMSVDCLKNLMNHDDKYKTVVCRRNNDGSMFKIGEFHKSEICAVVSEAIFKIGGDFLESTERYDTRMISSSVQQRINKDDITMSILRDNDLLDFPGARSREKEDVNILTDVNDNSMSILMNCYLRGKVAYLFNRSNETLLINVLLFCHDNEMNDVTELWHLLNEWVGTYIGKNSKERENNLKNLDVPPLFYIATKFNIDMQEGNSAVENGRNAIEGRWKGRFNTVLNEQCFHRNTVEWVNNWDGHGSPFKNCYLLRDYKYSDERNSRLYEGFRDAGNEMVSMMSIDYYNMMRSTFVENQYVKELFSDPEKAWDLAATMNNDGSLNIIESLSKAVEKLGEMRNRQFNEIIEDVTVRVVSEIEDYHISSNLADILEKNIRIANSIYRELDFTINDDNYYFGHLIQGLQISESECSRIIHELMQNPNKLNATNAFDHYQLIVNSCLNHGYDLSKLNNEDDCWNAIVNTYGFHDRIDAMDYLQRRAIDVSLLFSGDCRSQTNSELIADSIYSVWCSRIKSVEFMSSVTGNYSFDSSVMSNFVNNIINVSVRMKLKEKMSDSIAQYVNVINVRQANENLLADILSDAINDFVLDFGYSMYDNETVNNIRGIAQQNNLPVDADAQFVCGTPRLTEMFNQMSRNPQALIPPFIDHYNRWISYMYISFIAGGKLEPYDQAANNELGRIMTSIKGKL